MCGIVGYLGGREAVPILLNGLKRLEYRGYDSTGVALLHAGSVEVTRSVHRLADLETKLVRRNGHGREARVGIGHTRWATHGRPSEENAHPHTSTDGKIAVVHNGIFENFTTIWAHLSTHGHAARSETDTECFPMLLSHLIEGGQGFQEAFFSAVAAMDGKYALACVHADYPGRILLARSGPPLVVGIGDGEYFVASDVAPLLAHTREVVHLEDGDIGEISADGLRVFDSAGQPVVRVAQHIDWDDSTAELGTYQHFMQKEIFEQPQAVTHTLEAYLKDEEIALGLPFSDTFWNGIDRISILACGTSWHAGLVAKFLIEQIARVPVEVDYASEFRYRDPIVTERTLAIAITQSGETADTVSALKEAALRGARTLAVTNSVGSQVTRLAEGTLLTHAGVEMGVASTKAFTTQLAVFTLLALHLGRIRGNGEASKDARLELVRALRSLPALIEHAYQLENSLRRLAEKWHDAPSAFYLGRGPLYPVASKGRSSSRKSRTSTRKDTRRAK